MGSYVDRNLIKDEVVKYEAKISLWALMPQILSGAIGLIIGIMLGVNGYFTGMIILMALGGITWISPAIRYHTTELVITNKRVIAKVGLIRRETIELKVDKVESIQIQQGIFGRILNYGSIIISGAGNPQAPIKSIDKPLKFRKLVLEIQDEN